MFARASGESVGSPSKWILVKGKQKNKTMSTKTSPVSSTKQVAKKPVWIEKLSGKNVPGRRVKKVTQIKECGTQASTRKTDETESVSLLSGFSEKPISASKAQPRNEPGKRQK